jgi:endoglucanase
MILKRNNWLVCVMAGISLMSVISCDSSPSERAYIPPPTVTPPKERVSVQLHSISRLRAEGKQVLNAQNEPIVLRAVGLGYWLLQEGYMLNPHDQSKAANQWQMKRIYYREGLKEEEVEAFYKQWRDRFITESDIAYIASLGFNSVRLPLHYDLFLTSAQRSIRHEVIRDKSKLIDYTHALSQWLSEGELFNQDELEGFHYIDQLLQWCKKHQLYVVLDLHAAPGGQGADIHIADVLEPLHLWYGKDKNGENVYQNATIQLWKRIAQRYKNEDQIAWYDLINEPNQVPDNRWIHSLYQQLIRTIRAEGDQHLLMLEGNGWGNQYDFLLPQDFSNSINLIYSAHRYWITPQEDAVNDPNPNQINRIRNLIAFRDRINVPVWVGETGENTAEWMRINIRKLEDEAIGWCHWPLKRHDTHANAALMRIGGNFPTDGAYAMPFVLEHIQFNKNIPNPATIAAVAPIYY